MSLLPIIQQALLAGFGEEKILSFLANRVPALANGITKAKKSGFDPAKILRFLSYTLPRNKSKNIETQKNANDSYLSGIGIKTKEEREEQRNKFLKGALGVGAGILGATQLLKTSTPANASMETQTNPSLPKEQPQQAAQPSQQQSQAQQQNQSSITPTQSTSLIEQMGIGTQIKTLAQAGNTPEAIAAAIGVGLKPHQRKWFDEQVKSGAAKSLPDLITDYLAPENQLEKQPQQTTAKLVATPHGDIGEIKSQRNGKSLIDIEGKLHQSDSDQLIESPIPKKDLAELHEDLIRGIEHETGEEVSRNVNWAGYDPFQNSLAYLPHGGSLYIYDDINPEDADALTKILTKRKTSGQNFIGAWKEGTKSPIGAAMHQLIVRLQADRGGKGSEYSRKYPTVYSALEPAIRAAKEAKKKKKEKPYGR